MFCDIPISAWTGQIAIGISSGAFYAMLSLGLAIIFGMLNVINFVHGAQFMMGAFVAWMLATYLQVPYEAAIVLVPLLMGLFGMGIQRATLKKIHDLDHIYGLLLTFGLALLIEGIFRAGYGATGVTYQARPDWLSGALSWKTTCPAGPKVLLTLPMTRVWVICASLVTCIAVWLIIEKTRLGSRLRAATENPGMVQAFGIDVPLMVTLTYGAGVALAGLAGVLSATINSINPSMGAETIIVVFAVVVIGGMGSIMGAIVTGFMLGLLEALTKLFYPEAANIVVFVIMIVVLLVKPAGLFGRET